MSELSTFAFALAQTLPGGLLWGAPQWMVPAVVITLLIAAVVVWNYSQRGQLGPVRILASLLKIIAIVLIALCLLEPLRSGTRPRPQANVLPILVDNSQSMQLKTISADRSRGEAITDLLSEDAPWRVRLAQAFDVRAYSFDARLERIDNFDALPMNGYVSSLAGSLRALSERFSGRPVGGALLFTDGNLTDAPPADFDWASLGFPIYPVLPKSDEEVRDLRIADISVRQTDFESAPTTIRVRVDTVAMGDQTVYVQLIDTQSAKVVAEKTTEGGNDGQFQEVRFRFRPENSGVNFFRVAVFTEDDREELEAGEAELDQSDTVEATLANNQRVVAVNRATGPYRVLYLGGRPNWEYKFLRRALSEDAEVQLVALLRIANKEPKFSFRDRGVSDTNPLCAGLGADEEEAAQQYDEPVILRLGVKESEELSEGFPETAEELFAYHGIILDDIEPEFFTQDQMLLLRRFVGTRGGGLLMLGGQESFGGKSFGDSPLGELSPVYAPRPAAGDEPVRPVRLMLTREGMLQPWMRLRENELAEEERLRSMPGFLTLNRVGEVKPGASELATVETSDGRSVPAVVAQRFGRGRSAAITVGDLWRWAMRRDEQHPDDAAQAWRQLTHWLVGEVPKRAEVRVDASDDPSQPVTVVVEARDEAYLPLDNASVELKIKTLAGDEFTIAAQADDQQAGTYTATYWSAQPGGYLVEASVTGPDGSHVGVSRAGWAVQSGAAEFADLKLNRPLLEQIAAQTGGEIVRQDALEDFAADLPNRKVPVTETWVYPIWHRPWVMLMAMLCLCVEWGLRRWKGLA
ncbi:MAG: hypothetical protein MI861_14065 [Pirellulales bacterium]|nr:hypothetical protein [Pirellulales bacterium]